MGHFAYGETVSIEMALAQGISNTLTKAFAGSPPLDPWDMALLVDWLKSWAEEIFCDLFAIWVIGPCYSFAFIEIFDLTNVLNSSNGLNVAGTAPYLEFSQMHPALLFRIKQHLTLLKKQSWWPQFDVAKSHYYRVLELSESLTNSQFTFSAGSTLGPKALEAFFEIVPLVEQQIDALMNGLNPGLVEYMKARHLVQEYLQHGVVPSTIPDPDGTTKLFPNLVTVLNAAYSLYLESLDTLISRIDQQDSLSIRDRQKWTEKLEAWTLKAIEDHDLLTGQKSM